MAIRHNPGGSRAQRRTDSDQERPVVLLALANDRQDPTRYLRNLAQEGRELRSSLDASSSPCELIIRFNATLDDIYDVFVDPRYRGRVAIFHFAGHAGSYHLFLETRDGGSAITEANEFASFLAAQRSLALVFLNACSTRTHAELLIRLGIPAVIATDEEIEDQTARAFASRFYRSLIGGATMAEAYSMALRATQADSDTTTLDRYWRIHVGDAEAGQWTIRSAAQNRYLGCPQPVTSALPSVQYPEVYEALTFTGVPMQLPPMITLLDGLREDAWRRSHGFDEQSTTTAAVLLHPFARDQEREKALSRWFQAYQPCLFGRVAAAQGRIHYCFLTDDDLRQPDKRISEKIESERRRWKQRALNGGQYTRHGFVLVAASSRLQFSAPDGQMEAVARKLRDLAGWETEIDEAGNDRAFETVYLRNPQNQAIHKFTFTVDFFASAGEGRWWTDHRIPGGIAFTANSLGHMIRCREWYEGKVQQERWGLKVAIRTIATAQETALGKATWLLDVQNGRPLKPLACPFENPQAHLGKDWTAYEGLLHTDHSLRHEFFTGEVQEPKLEGRPWLMDLTYIYDHEQPDYKLFMGENLVSEAFLYQEIGKPDEWRVRSEPQITRRPPESSIEIRNLLRTCESWPVPEEIE